MFGRKKPQTPEAADEHLKAEVQKALPGADAETVAIVSACAGLLASVAYADREFSPAEREHARRLLATVSGIGENGALAIVSVLAAKVLELSTVHATRFSRTLKELGDRELRLHVLEMLIELCAADDELRHQEVVVLRQITGALGLEQSDYNRLQEKHRNKLGDTARN
jgi:uncharacterized tellurite resistance protein B-like protein